MIQIQSRLQIVDNSGALIVSCIKVTGKTGMRYTVAANEIMSSLKKVRPLTTMKKGEVKRCVIVRNKTYLRRKNGIRICFFDNAGIVLNLGGDPIASRAFGPLTSELRQNGYTKVSALGELII